MTSSKNQTGFTLLEVILALAILAGALTVLGELARRSLHNAEVSRATSEAQLLCESKLAEMAAGVTPVNPVVDAPWQSVPDTEIETNDAWFYSVEVDSTGLDGLLAVCVTLSRDRPVQKGPESVWLTRWIIDPGIEMQQQ